MKKLIAKAWPFGKWVPIWEHAIDGEYPSKKGAVDKETAMEAFHQFSGLNFNKIVKLKKEGGFLNGIEYRPKGRKKSSPTTI